jgi:4-carboxymuconolactone decarboxylase
VRAVATVSMFNLGDARRRAMGLLSYEERMKRLKDAGEQRSKEARGEPVRLVPVVPESPAEFTEKTPDLYRQGYQYYITPRAKHPNSPNRYMFSSLPLQMAFFPFDQVETISPRPIRGSTAHMTRSLRVFPARVLVAMAVVVHGCAHQQAPSREATVSTEWLSVKQQRLVAIAAFTANGNLPKLSTALSKGLDASWTINEFKEVLVQLYAYAGFPRSLNGLNTFIDVLDDRQGRGIADEVGREPSPLPAHKSSIELGAEIQTRLVGGPATGRYVAFSPAIDAFLKGHLFGDILGRDNLDVQSRELATISALATLEGVNPQLTSHFNVGLNTGLTEAQLRGVTFAIDDAVGKARGDNARRVLAQVIGKRPGGSHPDSVLSTGRGSSAEARISIRVRQEQLVESAPLEHFKGFVRVQRLFQASDPARASGASVTFEPGARGTPTRWARRSW